MSKCTVGFSQATWHAFLELQAELVLECVRHPAGRESRPDLQPAQALVRFDVDDQNVMETAVTVVGPIYVTWSEIVKIER